MPIQKCMKDNKPGYKYGKEGYCYTYEVGNKKEQEKAYTEARKQGIAILKPGGE